MRKFLFTPRLNFFDMAAITAVPGIYKLSGSLLLSFAFLIGCAVASIYAEDRL